MSSVTSKWTAAGYVSLFEGGSAVIAHLEGCEVWLAWQSLGDVAHASLPKTATSCCTAMSTLASF